MQLRSVALSVRTLSISLLLGSVMLALPELARGQPDLMDDDVRVLAALDEFEFSGAGRDATIAWDGDFWVGTDLTRFWFKTEGERIDQRTERSEAQLLYSRAFAPFWDFMAGIRHDFAPSPDQDWLVVGVQGLAPYWFDVEANLFVSDDGQKSLRVRSNYELLLTQRLIVEPEAEVTAFAHTDARRGLGSGLSTFEFGVRLRYEVRREFAPYVGLRWTRHVGATADFVRASGRDDDDWEFVIGLRFWH